MDRRDRAWPIHTLWRGDVEAGTPHYRSRVLPGLREFVVQRSVEVWLELPAQIIGFDLGSQPVFVVSGAVGFATPLCVAIRRRPLCGRGVVKRGGQFFGSAPFYEQGLEISPNGYVLLTTKS